MQTTQTDAGFWEWFEEERHRRRLSLRAIEAAGGQPSGWLQKRMAAGLQPTFDGCKAIAAAFGLPLESVLRRAGLLPLTEKREELDRLLEAAAGLTPARLAVLIEVAEAFAAAEGRTEEQKRYRIVGSPPSRTEFRRLLRRLPPEDLEDLLREFAGPEDSDEEPAEG